MDKTHKIVACGVGCGLLAALVIALVWGCEARQASRVAAPASTASSQAGPPASAYWVADRGKKTWHLEPTIPLKKESDFEVTGVIRSPEDVSKKPEYYTLYWRVKGDPLLMGGLYIKAGEGWENRAADMIRADIVNKLALRAAEAKTKAAVEKAMVKP